MSIDLHHKGWIKHMLFDAGVEAVCEPYPDSDEESIANLIYTDAQP